MYLKVRLVRLENEVKDIARNLILHLCIRMMLRDISFKLFLYGINAILRVPPHIYDSLTTRYVLGV